MSTTTKQKHAPGPFRARSGFISDAYGNTIAEVHAGGNTGAVRSADEIEANSNLFAAAPELLAACERVVAFLDGAASREDMVNCVWRAIAMARDED